MRGLMRVFAVLVAVVLFAAAVPLTAQAYYERDPVTITLSSASVSVDINGTSSVTCKVTPQSEKQLPGCGMEGCPQTCGDGCLDKNGWCTCAGLSYETYTTSVLVSSSASNVATGRYANGILKVKGVSTGTATLTLTGQLSKHLDATATVKVTVSSKVAASTDSGSDSDSTSGSESGQAASSGASHEASNGGASAGSGTPKVEKSSSGAKAVSAAKAQQAAKKSKTGTAITALATSATSSNTADGVSGAGGSDKSSGATSVAAGSGGVAAASGSQSADGLNIGFDNGFALDPSAALTQLDITGADSSAMAGDSAPLPVFVLALLGLAALAFARLRLKKQGKL